MQKRVFQLLFQRLTLACGTGEELAAVFQYELSSYPSALFESTLMMNAAPKPALAEAIWSMLSPTEKGGPSSADRIHYVLDGGALLHRVQWPKGTPTYRDVFSVYCSYVKRKYDAATIVFDGYDEVSSKYTTQKRRVGGKRTRTSNVSLYC